MATREENLKKINEELEKLSDEQLDWVSGGTIAETVKDTQFLHALGLLDRAYTASEVQSDPFAVQRKIDGAIHLVMGGNHHFYGVGVNTNSANTYELNYIEENEPTQYYTREGFLNLVCSAAGQPGFDVSKYL